MTFREWRELSPGAAAQRLLAGVKSLSDDQRRAIFISADDADAKAAVSRLIEEIGFGPYDMGSLAASHRQQPDSAVYNKDVTVAEARAMA